MLEKLSWLAGIASLVVAIVAYLWPSSTSDPKDARQGQPSTPQTINQVAGPNSTQIGNVNGSVVVNNNGLSQNDSEPVEITGQWDQVKARQLVQSQLRSTKWSGIDKDLEAPLEHTEVGQYSLLYRNREGLVLAYSTITRESVCHACAPYLSFFEFEKRPKGWKQIGSYIAVRQDGSWGSPPKMSVAVIADDRFGVMLETGYMAQGWIVGATSIHTKMGDSFREVLSLMTNQAAPDERAWDSTITFKPTTTGLYDIEVNRKGQHGPKDLVWLDGNDKFKPDVSDHNGNIRPRDVFRFDGQAYRRNELVR